MSTEITSAVMTMPGQLAQEGAALGGGRWRRSCPGGAGGARGVAAVGRGAWTGQRGWDGAGSARTLSAQVGAAVAGWVADGDSGVVAAREPATPVSGRHRSSCRPSSVPVAPRGRSVLPNCLPDARPDAGQPSERRPRRGARAYVADL